MEQTVQILGDSRGKEIVYVNKILFKGKRSIKWNEVKEYLRSFVGKNYRIKKTKEIIYIGNDLPNEYTGSAYTYNLKGAAAKAKANAAQGIPELIQTAEGKHYRKNLEEKHNRNAKYGWYRYDSKFALPVYNAENQIQRYNIFHASLLVRHSEDQKLYLYDVIDIKKETSNPLES